jgi:hypothetical protein
MQQTTKKKIAMEIIIFFGSVVLIVLIWTGFFAKNNYDIRQAGGLKKKIEKLNIAIDSIKDSVQVITDYKTIYKESLIPKSFAVSTYEKEQLERKQLDYESKFIWAKVYSSDDLKKIALWITGTVLTIVYPFRFAILLLLWAFRTLR